MTIKLIKKPDKWDFVSISCGRDHTLALLASGHVFGWGSYGSGRLPSTLPEYCTSPATRTGAVEIRNDTKIKAISAGYGVSLAISERSEVQVWGSNNIGVADQLKPINPVFPLLLSGLNHIQSVVAGEFQFGAIDQRGQLYTWVMNDEGALGREVRQLNSSHGKVADIPPVSQLAVGRGHMLAIGNDFCAYAWGKNGAGQLGLGCLSSVSQPQKVHFPSLSPIHYKAVAAGTTHSLGLCKQGRVYAWGSNHHGQLGCEGVKYATEPVLVHLHEPIQAISAGMHFSVALAESGHVYVWGWNGYGQLGLGDIVDRRLPTQLKQIKGVSALSAGETHVVAITSDGLVGWGGNSKSQLGKLERQQKTPALLI